MPGRAAQDGHPWNSSHRRADWRSLLRAQTVGRLPRKPCLLRRAHTGTQSLEDAGGMHSAQQGQRYLEQIRGNYRFLEPKAPAWWAEGVFRVNVFRSGFMPII